MAGITRRRFIEFVGTLLGSSVFGSRSPSVLDASDAANTASVSVDTWHHCAGVWAAINDRRAFLDRVLADAEVKDVGAATDVSAIAGLVDLFLGQSGLRGFWPMKVDGTWHFVSAHEKTARGDITVVVDGNVTKELPPGSMLELEMTAGNEPSNTWSFDLVVKD